MLYCDGGDLYTKIKEQNGKYLEETQIVEWFVQIAMALQVKRSLKQTFIKISCINSFKKILVHARKEYTPS
jgi:hypothetical protein